MKKKRKGKRDRDEKKKERETEREEAQASKQLIDTDLCTRNLEGDTTATSGKRLGKIIVPKWQRDLIGRKPDLLKKTI